jgi:sugar/nucleoside kinase (ribokinase family)
MAKRWEKAERLVITGSILVDVLVYVDALPSRGGDVLASERHLASGGGFNVLYAASRQGLPGAYLGRIGDGPFGRQVAGDLEREQISALLEPCSGADTGFCIGIVDKDGERSFLTCPGVEAELDGRDLDGVVLGSSDVVYISGYDLTYPISGPALAGFVRSLPAEVLFVVDPGPLAAASGAAELLALLGRIDLFSVSASEARELTGFADPETSTIALARMLAPSGLAVVRTGAEGCWLAQQGRSGATHVAAYDAAALDTTGAGDTHVGTMVACLAKGATAAEAAQIANLAAAVAIERRGGASAPSAAELAAAARDRSQRGRSGVDERLAPSGWPDA